MFTPTTSSCFPDMIALHGKELKSSIQETFHLERNIFQNFHDQKPKDWKLFISNGNVK